MEGSLKIKSWTHTYEDGVMHMYVGAYVREALANILDGLQDMRDDSALCQALADHPDFCELAARVACVKSLRSELDIRNPTDAEYTTLYRLAADSCAWTRNEAKGALDDLANPLPDQVAAMRANGFELELSALEDRGVTINDHALLNYIRANSKGEIRDRAGALLVKLAGVAK